MVIINFQQKIIKHSVNSRKITIPSNLVKEYGLKEGMMVHVEINAPNKQETKVTE